MKNNGGYTLMEMIVVLTITSTILIFFTQTLMNNFQIIRKYKKNSPEFIKLQVLNRLQKDLDKCSLLWVESNKIEMEAPLSREENRYFIGIVSYRVISNQLIRRETGEEDKSNVIDIANFSINMDWQIVTNVSNLVIGFIDTNGQKDDFRLGMFPKKGLK